MMGQPGGCRPLGGHTGIRTPSAPKGGGGARGLPGQGSTLPLLISSGSLYLYEKESQAPTSFLSATECRVNVSGSEGRQGQGKVDANISGQTDPGVLNLARHTVCESL